MNNHQQTHHMGRAVGRLALGITSLVAACVLTTGAALAAPSDPLTETESQTTTVFWKEIVSIDDTNDNGAIGDPGDTMVTAIYLGAPQGAEGPDQVVVDDPMLFGAQPLIVPIEDVTASTLREYGIFRDTERKFIEEVSEQLGGSKKHPERANFQMIDDRGVSVIDEDGAPVIDDSKYQQAVEQHQDFLDQRSQIVRQRVLTSPEFTVDGNQWVRTPEPFMNAASQ